MKHPLITYKVLAFVGAGLVYLSGQFLRGVWFPSSPINTCYYTSDARTDIICGSPYAVDVGWPLIHAGEIFAVVALILIVANAVAMWRWWRFSRWYIPIAAFIIFYFFPRPFLILVIDRYPMVTLFGGLYLIITLGIVVWGYFSARKMARALAVPK